jgi:putative transposase
MANLVPTKETKTMTQPTFKRNREVAPEQLVSALTDVLQKYLPLTLQHTRITPAEAYQVLAYAAVRGTTLESACAALPQAASGNRLREVLRPALPEQSVLQSRLNRLLRAHLHPSLWKKPRGLHLAIDLVLIPYHGQPQEQDDEVMRGPARAGTTHFHGYATATLVHDKRRYTLALRFVRKGETMDTIVRWLLDRIKRLKLWIQRVYLDSGFASVPVFKTLARRRLAYLVPLPARGRSGGVRVLFTGPRSYRTNYTLDSHTFGTCRVPVAVRLRYYRGRKHKHGRWWLVYAASQLPRGISPQQVAQWYRRRFGIETTYRLMNRVRARTSSRSPVLRLLLVGLALVLVNLDVTLRRAGQLVRCTPAQPAQPQTAGPVWLERLATLIRQTIEANLGGPLAVRLHQPVSFS